MRERNGGGCDRLRPFSVIAIWAGIVLARCRGGTVTSSQVSSGIGIMHLCWGLLSCLKRHSLRPGNGAELPRQFQSRQNLVCDQRLSTARPGSQGPVFIGIGGTHQSGLGTEGVRLLLESASPLLSSSEGSWIAGKLTKLAPYPEEPVPGAACPWGGVSTRGTEHPYVHASHTCLSTPLNQRSGQRVCSGRDGRVGDVGEMARSHFRSSISYLCVGVDWIGASVV